MGFTDVIEEKTASMGIKYWGSCPLDPLLPLFENSAARRLPKSAKTVVSFLFPYFTEYAPDRNLSYYCVIPDYHIVAGKMLSGICESLAHLYPNSFFIPFVDTSPINEVKAAELCGLGNIGKNGLLINKEYGALCFVGSIITDHEYSTKKNENNHGCTNCGRCITACPTKALSPDGFNPQLCLSAITQQKSDLSPQQIQLIKHNRLAWGCDHCSLACPITPKVTPIVAFRENIVSVATPENLVELMNNRAFAYRGIKVITRNLEIINSENKALGDKPL